MNGVVIQSNEPLMFSVASEIDEPFVYHLQLQNRESLGFLPRMAITERVRRGRVFLGRLNGQLFGYLLFDVRFGYVNVLQACIQYDARRRLYGAALYQWALLKWRPEHVRLKCAADLESNLFWRSMGLICVDVIDGGKRRGRKINVWHHILTTGLFVPSGCAPVFQLRQDCMDAETDFLATAPDGFIDGGSLGKLAWKNRKP